MTCFIDRIHLSHLLKDFHRDISISFSDRLTFLLPFHWLLHPINSMNRIKKSDTRFFSTSILFLVLTWLNDDFKDNFFWSVLFSSSLVANVIAIKINWWAQVHNEIIGFLPYRWSQPWKSHGDYVCCSRENIVGDSLATGCETEIAGCEKPRPQLQRIPTTALSSSCCIFSDLIFC